MKYADKATAVNRWTITTSTKTELVKQFAGTVG